MMFYKLHTIEDDLQFFRIWFSYPYVFLMFPLCFLVVFNRIFFTTAYRPSLEEFEEVLRSRLLVDIGSLGLVKNAGWMAEMERFLVDGFLRFKQQKMKFGLFFPYMVFNTYMYIYIYRGSRIYIPG